MLCYMYVFFILFIQKGVIMNKEQRQNEILELVLKKECCSVKELCAALYASDATIRRDLHCLEQKGLIRLLYGNIVPLMQESHDHPLAFRENQAKATKRDLARYAVSLIPPHASVMLDSSSSALYLADYLNPDYKITVFTNCIKTATKLHEKNITVFLLGGQLDSHSLVTSSVWTLENIRAFHVDYLFFSAQSLSSDGFIAGATDFGVHVRKYMLRQATQSYFLCNAEKVGTHSTYTLCHASEITGVITNIDLSFLPDVKFINISTRIHD